VENNSKSNPFFSRLSHYIAEGSIPSKYGAIIEQFYLCYREALASSEGPVDDPSALFLTLLDLIKQQCLKPFEFEPYHRLIRKPFDYYQFGLDLVKPLVDLPHCTLSGQENIKTIVSSLERGENVIFLANHQIEADPQAISILLEDSYPKLGEEMIFVAGERVITDPLAVPASMGRNLLCIYSKRYIDNPPEMKREKQLHNKRTMELMSQLLSEGGKAIYVAPSGGRDRPNKEGKVEVAAFDAQSIEMFYLMAQRAGHPTHFYPLALKTYAMLPPPETIQVELGETRVTRRAPIHIHFGQQIDMQHFPGSDCQDKHTRRALRAEYICSLVQKMYAQFPVQ